MWFKIQKVQKSYGIKKKKNLKKLFPPLPPATHMSFPESTNVSSFF